MGTPDTADLSYGGIYSRVIDASDQESALSFSVNKGNGSGAYGTAVNMMSIGANNSFSGAIVINPASASSIPTHNLDVNGTAHFSGNVTFAGDVTISGSQTTKNSEVVLIEDNIITLNSNETGSASEDSGIEVERGTSTNVKFQFKESTDRWQFTNDGSTYFSLPTSTADITENTNLYYTNARADARIANAIVDEDNMASNSATQVLSLIHI